MILYGGHQVLLHDAGGKIDRWMKRHLPVEDLFPSSPLSVAHVQSGTLTYTNETPAPALRLNQIYIPTGASRWGQALFLVTDRVMRGLLELVGDVNEPQPLSINGVDLGRWRMLSPRPISRSGTDRSIQDGWLLPLVDERYSLEFRSMGSSVGWEVDTRVELINKMDAELGLSDPVADPFVAPNLEFDSNDYAPLSAVVDAVANDWGCRLVPRGNSWEMYSFNSADFDDDLSSNLAGRVLIAGERSEELQAARCPSRVVFHFGDGTVSAISAGVGRVDLPAANGAEVVYQLMSTATGNVQGDIANALWDGIQKRCRASYDYTFSGFVDWSLLPTDDFLVYEFDHVDGGFRAQTRVRSLPSNVYPRRVSLQADAGSADSSAGGLVSVCDPTSCCKDGDFSDAFRISASRVVCCCAAAGGAVARFKSLNVFESQEFTCDDRPIVPVMTKWVLDKTAGTGVGQVTATLVTPLGTLVWANVEPFKERCGNRFALQSGVLAGCDVSDICVAPTACGVCECGLHEADPLVPDGFGADGFPQYWVFKNPIPDCCHHWEFPYNGDTWILMAWEGDGWRSVGHNFHDDPACDQPWVLTLGGALTGPNGVVYQANLPWIL